MTAGIICVEGADCSGKTTLVNHIRTLYPAHVMHCRLWRDYRRWHLGILRRALRLVVQGELVLLDRHWISQGVYQPIFEKTCYDDVTMEACDLGIAGAPGIYVLCVPHDMPAHMERFRKRKAAGREAYDRIEQVARSYADLLYGNVAHPGSNYLDRYCQFGDFMERRNVVHYDLDRDGADLDRTARRIINKLRATS